MFSYGISSEPKAQSNKFPLYSFGAQINYETWSFDYSLRTIGWNMEFNDC